MTGKGSAKPGLGVDAQGNPVIDPTQNVLDLVAAAIARQDDLREANARLFESRIDGLRDEINARLDCFSDLLNAAESLRLEQKSDTRTSVEAAFSAASALVRQQAESAATAITKSEIAAGAQIKAVETTLDDLKGRLGKVETEKQTRQDTREDSRSSVGMVVGVVGVVFSLLFLLIAAVTLFLAVRVQ